MHPAAQEGRSRALEGADPDILRWREDLAAQKRSPYTIKHYSLAVRQFQDWTHKELDVQKPLRSLGASDLKAYQIWLSTQKGYAKNTLYFTIKALQAFYRFVGSDAAETLKPPKRAQALPKYLSEAEASRLLEAAADSPCDHALLSLLLYGGLRVGELTRIEVPDLDFDELTVRIHSGKGDKDRLVIISPKCAQILKEWLKTRPATASDYLFPGLRGSPHVSVLTVQRIVLRRAKKAGLEKHVTPHVLRHTLATTLLRRGGDIRFIQRILGHASIATTQIYTHLDDAELKRMYERASPEF